MTDAIWTEEHDDGFIGLVGPIYSRPIIDGVGHFRFVSQSKHKNRAGFVQGGMLMTFADRAMGKTARQNDRERAQATAQFDMQLFEPARIGDTIDIACTVSRQTKHLVFMRAELTVNGRPVANAQGVWKIIAKA